MVKLCGIVVGLLLVLHGQLGLAAPEQALVREAGLLPVEPPQPAKDFHLPDLAGQVYRLQALRGNVVFLNFWATWCVPCRLEMPEMEHLFQAFRNRPFTMLAVAMQQNREHVAPFFKELDLHYTALLDVEGDASARYGVRGLPTTLLIDCSGHLVGKVTGPRPWNTDAVHRLVSALLQDQQCG
jgi:peroxiredoxin